MGMPGQPEQIRSRGQTHSKARAAGSGSRFRGKAQVTRVVVHLDLVIFAMIFGHVLVSKHRDAAATFEHPNDNRYRTYLLFAFTQIGKVGVDTGMRTAPGSG